MLDILIGLFFCIAISAYFITVYLMYLDALVDIEKRERELKERK